MTPSWVPPSTLLAGKIRLLQRIGRGGMGDVWIARNEATQAEVAVKTLQKNERTPAHDERFRREARFAATVSHRNVVRVFDLIDEPDGTLGLVMELLRGGTLEACMRERGPLTTTQALAVALSILSALEHVHQKGIVHRDVKPANIFFAVEPDGHVIPKILDFGIAKLPAANSVLTVDGSVLGTPHYMAPEQIRGLTEIDGRSDMFSLAAVLYELLTGIRPFHRTSAAASLAAVLEFEVEPDPRIEPRLWIAISRALAKRPYERFATCAEFAASLRAAVDSREEDYALALEELRPVHDAMLDVDGGMAASWSPRARGSLAPKSPRGRTKVWLGALGAAAVAATLAVSLARSRSQPSGEPVHVASASSPVVASPPAVSAGAAPAAPVSATVAAARSSAPSGLPASPPRTPRRAPKVGPAAAPRAVATSPGF